MQTRRERLSILSSLFSPYVVGKGEEQKSQMDPSIRLVTAVETIGNRKLKDFGRENRLFQVPVEGTSDHHHSFFSQECFKPPCGESCSRAGSRIWSDLASGCVVVLTGKGVCWLA